MKKKRDAVVDSEAYRQIGKVIDTKVKRKQLGRKRYTELPQ